MTWKGWVIEESLADTSILSGLKVIKTLIEENVEGKEKQVWKLHTVEIDNKGIYKVAEKLEKALKPKWYAHFTDGYNLLIVFANRSFTIRLEKAGKEKETGITYFKAIHEDKLIWKSAFEYGTKTAKVDSRYLLEVE